MVLRKREVLIVVSIAVASFLIGTTFNTTVASDGGNPFDTIWGAIHSLQSELGGVNATLASRVVDLEAELSLLQTNMETLQAQIDSLNAANLDLLERVETLEKQMLPEGFARAPAYDSGWIFSNGYTETLHHGLGTTRVLVQLIGRNSLSEPISGDIFNGGQQTMCWKNLTPTHIDVWGRYGCKYVRVMLWKIKSIDSPFLFSILPLACVQRVTEDQHYSKDS